MAAAYIKFLINCFVLGFSFYHHVKLSEVRYKKTKLNRGRIFQVKTQTILTKGGTLFWQHSSNFTRFEVQSLAPKRRRNPSFCAACYPSRGQEEDRRRSSCLCSKQATCQHPDSINMSPSKTYSCLFWKEKQSTFVSLTKGSNCYQIFGIFSCQIKTK